MNTILSRGRLTLLFVLLCACYFLIDFPGSHPVEFVLKILPTLMLLLALLERRRALGAELFAREVGGCVLLALVASMIGDIAGDFKPIFGDIAFILQIFFFCIAQICYARSFMRHCGTRSGMKLSAGAVAVKQTAVWLVFSYLAVLVPMLAIKIESPAIFVAIFVYMLLISAMCFLAIAQKRPGQFCFMSGALLFVLSDSLIAINTFISHVPHAGFWIMLSYFAAQYLMNIRLVDGRRGVTA